MNRTVYICIAVLMLLNDLIAQDQLFKSDNTKLLVKIIEIGPEVIKYKMHDNPDGPSYAADRKEVSLIIYQNGAHEVILGGAVTDKTPASGVRSEVAMSRKDSLTYYSYANNFSVNFLNFFNNEVGVMYRREFFEAHFNITVPFAIGVAKPGITQAVYFQRGPGPVRIELGNKIFETGFGIHYYPSLRTHLNYYIGPAIRFMQYNCRQSEVSTTWGIPFQYNNTTLTRYTLTITNGFVLRTRSRLTTSIFASIGFKRDEVSDPLFDHAGVKVVSIPNPVSFYWWSGFQAGFNF